jgi:histidine ammonia-lyase/tyrosine ammonia-lyase
MADSALLDLGADNPAMTANQRLAAFFKRRLAFQPYPLVVTYHDGQPVRVCPGASLWTGARQIGEALAGLGIQPGDRIAAELPNGVEFIQLMLGVWRAGATFCPMPFEGGNDERFADLDARLRVRESDFDALLCGDAEPYVAGARLPTPDVAVILRTSGSTGSSKSVALSPDEILRQAELHAEALGLVEASPCVGYLSWSHAFGGVLELLSSLVARLEIHLPCPRRFDHERLVRALDSHRGAAFFTVPKVLGALLADPGARPALAALRTGIVGGAPIGSELASKLTALGSRLHVGYGLTECSPGVMLGPAGVFRPGLLGRPIGCEVRVDDHGELLVRGANVALARWTGEPLPIEDGWLRTGDLVTTDDDGLYVFRGRTNGIWKWSNGKAYNPGPVEQAASEAAGAPVVLFKAPDDSVQPVVLADDVPSINLPSHLRSLPPICLGAAALDLCQGPSGKLKRERIAEEGVKAGARIDPVVYAQPTSGLIVGRGARLTARALAAAARSGLGGLRLTATAREEVARCHEFACRMAATDLPIYGWKTGFGPHVVFQARATPDDQGLGLIAHLQAGQGSALAPEIVRAMLVLRLHTVAQGHSGVSPECVDWLKTALASDLAPVVPCTGSVGASGDLIPMAHAVAAFLGEGAFLTASGPRPAREVLDERRLPAIPLRGRDALGLVNGTPLMTATGALALERARQALRGAIALTACLYDVLGCNHQPLGETLHRGSGHPAHERVAADLRQALTGADPGDRPLQESYSIRCAPQLLGAALTVLDAVEEVVENELNGVSDNPFFDPTASEILHGGAFFGQEIAFAMDSLANAVIQMANLAERQLWLLLEPSQTGLPLLLSPQPGAHSGLAGVQLCATATVVEMRRQAVPASVQSLPTNGMNQDVVPLGVHAAQNAAGQVERLELVLGALALSVRQAYHLAGREPRGIGPRRLMESLADIEPLEADRGLAADVRRAAELLLGAV